MRITANMDINALAERMGHGANRGDAYHMRALLVADYAGQDTADIHPEVWDSMLVEVARGTVEDEIQGWAR